MSGGHFTPARWQSRRCRRHWRLPPPLATAVATASTPPRWQLRRRRRLAARPAAAARCGRCGDWRGGDDGGRLRRQWKALAAARCRGSEEHLRRQTEAEEAAVAAESGGGDGGTARSDGRGGGSSQERWRWRRQLGAAAVTAAAWSGDGGGGSQERRGWRPQPGAVAAARQPGAQRQKVAAAPPSLSGSKTFKSV